MKTIGKHTLAPSSIFQAKELKEVQDLMPISKHDYEKLRDDIQKHGVKDSLRGYYKAGDFYILSGLTRLKIAIELSIPLVPIEVIEIKAKDRGEFAIQENLARRHLSTKQKNELVEYLLKNDPSASSRIISKRAGVSPTTVEKIRTVSTVQFGQLTRTGLDGKNRTMPKKKESTGQIDQVKNTGFPKKKIIDIQDIQPLPMLNKKEKVMVDDFILVFRSLIRKHKKNLSRGKIIYAVNNSIQKELYNL